MLLRNISCVFKVTSPGAARLLVTGVAKVTIDAATPPAYRRQGLPRRLTTLPADRQAQAGGVPLIAANRRVSYSHDPLRDHVLKQCSPNRTACLRLFSAAHRGLKVECQGYHSSILIFWVCA
ncbi:MAG: hypothetical protein PHP85_05055 [Gallionella sp.]|nr:hypothetical protein [Gallionella sp.]